MSATSCYTGNDLTSILFSIKGLKYVLLALITVIIIYYIMWRIYKYEKQKQ